MALSGTALMAGVKEIVDWHDHKDRWWESLVHFTEIEGGAGIVAEAWH